MLFNSYSFVVFLTGVLVVYSLPFPWTMRKCILLAASYLFYATWKPWFVALLLFATASNFAAAAVISRLREDSPLRLSTFWTCIVANLVLLGTFKYGNQLMEAINCAASWLGLEMGAPQIAILLPVGLSFFTFQALSYTIDVYRHDISPADSLLDFALFVAFFPVLLAGPLLRAGDFLRQCHQPRRATVDELAFGLALFTLGIFMKVSLADSLLAPVVDQVYAQNSHPDALAAWTGTIAFAGQDYCDFAGYSTCAMGIGVCLGFSLPENFRAPFASVGFRDLWQRWHITLVAWMRDYVFLSLGGVFRGYRRAAINVLVVFLLIGLWHGASVTYLIFGLLHGTYLIVETALQRSRLRRIRLWNTVPGIALLWLATMFLSCIAFVFYRSSSVDRAWEFLGTMCGLTGREYPLVVSDYHLLSTIVVAELLVIVHWLRRRTSLPDTLARFPWWANILWLAGVMFAITVSSGGKAQNFLYFQY